MRRMLAIGVAMVLAATATACTSDQTARRPGAGGGPALPAVEAAGLVPGGTWRGRQDDYLRFATTGRLDRSDPLSLLAHAEADQRSGDGPDIAGASTADFEPIFTKLRTFTDTGDFDVNRLITLWKRYRRALDPELADAIRTRILAFKYWWTEPTPKGVIDNQYYWTENHQIIYLANEYVAGQTFPDETFTNSAMTGRKHVAHAKVRLEKWLDWRARFGFSEWLSNVYWNEDYEGLLLLAEFADDATIARKASMMLDLLFVELASHVQKGTFGSTHGRSYQKDKLNGRDEDTFSIVKMVFDETPVPYANADSATLLAVAHRYRPPEVARQIASSPEVAVVRQRQSLPLDPTAPVDPDVKAPYGLSFTGEDGLMVWWGLGGQFPWQVAPLSVRTVKTYDLFRTANFKKAASLESVVENADDPLIRRLSHALAIQVNPGLLTQVDTYTRRSPGVMLSTAQDWRPGERGDQDHIWQATIDPDALVFTQHPRDPVPSRKDPDDDEGYWTGDAAMPRSAQWDNVNISIYAPQYEGGDGIGSGAYSFGYQPFTHAFFPTEHFDEVVRRDGWTIGRKGAGYIALWSQRPTQFRTYDPETEFTRGLTKPFDLIAKGGPDDVWITEVADASDYAQAGPSVAARFDAFVEAITAAPVEVTPAPSQPCPAGGRCPPDPAAGAQVRYRSPSQGEISFGWAPKSDDPLTPLTVAGKAVDLHPDEIRWDSPWAKAGWDSKRYHAEAGGATLDLDFDKTTRHTTR